MNINEGDKTELVMHFVLGENEHNLRFAKNLAEHHWGTVTLVDSKYIATELEGNVTYANMDIVRHTFDIPDKLYFYSYMDPENRKKKGERNTD